MVCEEVKCASASARVEEGVRFRGSAGRWCDIETCICGLRFESAGAGRFVFIPPAAAAAGAAVTPGNTGLLIWDGPPPKRPPPEAPLQRLIALFLQPGPPQV